MADTKKPNDVAAMSYEVALAELESIVAELERGDVPLAKSIEAYERGEALRQHCKALLRQAEQRIEKLRISDDGQVEGAVALDQGV